MPVPRSPCAGSMVAELRQTAAHNKSSRFMATSRMVGAQHAAPLLLFLAEQRHLECGLEHEPVAGACRPETHAQMPGDVVPEPQICRRIDLMEFLGLEEGAVVLEPERHDSADSDAHACPRLEFPLVLGTGEIALQRGVGEQLDRTKTSLESWRQLEGPRALAERRPRRLVFGAESKTHGQPPGLGRAHAGAKPPACIIEPQSGRLRAQEVAGQLPMIRDAARHLGGKAPLALRWRHTAVEATRPTAREVEQPFELPFAALRRGVGVDSYIESFLR